MTSEKLQRTSYRDPNTPDNRVRTGTTSLPESGQDMDQFYRPLERIHTCNLHGWGVASGLTVSTTLNDAKLTLQPGVALDSRGQHISLAVGSNAEVGPNPDGFSTGASFIPVTASGVVLPTTGITGDKYLTIQFWETFDSDSFNTQGAFRYWHTPWLQLVDVAAFTNNGSRIVLAKVSFGTGPSAGQVTALSQELRQATALPAGGVHVQKQVSSSAAGSTKVEMVEAGTLQAHARGGLDLTVPNATDEIHLSRSDGGNFAKVSLGADHIVALQANGQESVVIDTGGGNITMSGAIKADHITTTNVTASGAIKADHINATNVTVADDLSATNIGADDTVNTTTLIATDIEAKGELSGNTVRQNSLYLSGKPGWSSISYNAHHNDDNTGWVFPDPSRPAVTIEMDDSGGAPRLQVWGTIPGNTQGGWVPRFFIDVNTGNVWTNGQLVQNQLYLSGGDGWSSLSYNAHHNEDNTDWVFPDPSRPAVTIEMDDNGGNPRFQVWSTVPGNTQGWQPRFFVDGITGNAKAAGVVIATGAVAVLNAQDAQTIRLDANAGKIFVGAQSVDGMLRVRNAANQATCVLTGQNGAAFFAGDVTIGGTLQVNGPIVKSGGGFKIDHPLDPEHKYLEHSFVESPDRKNVYDGVAVLDANGEATVELPEWFSALNSDARYQLTCIGGYAPVYIAREIDGNRFSIAGGKPGMKVSWQVTGIRQDAWARAHPLYCEQEKSPAEHGAYLHPEEHGADSAASINALCSVQDDE